MIFSNNKGGVVMKRCNFGSHWWIFFAAIWLLTPSHNAFAVDGEYVWLAVRVLDGGRQRAAGEYYGRLEKRQFEALVSNSMTKGFFKLESTAWFDENVGMIKMSDSKSHGRQRGYGGTSYFRIELVTRIIVVDEKFVQSNLARVGKQK